MDASHQKKGREKNSPQKPSNNRCNNSFDYNYETNDHNDHKYETINWKTIIYNKRQSNHRTNGYVHEFKKKERQRGFTNQRGGEKTPKKNPHKHLPYLNIRGKKQQKNRQSQINKDQHNWFLSHKKQKPPLSSQRKHHYPPLFHQLKPPKCLLDPIQQPDLHPLPKHRQHQQQLFKNQEHALRKPDVP